MYTIYDLELNREIVATLSYIALQSGIKLKNKNQFNYIIYKLYNYLKDDFVFENGIVINEAIKEKINNFKIIHADLYYPVGNEPIEEYYCTFPKYAQNSATSPYIDDEYTTLEDIDDCDDRLYKIPYKFWCDPKNASDYCSVQLEVKHKTTEAITKLISYTSKQILANLDYWELYISTNAAKTAYTITRKSYNTDGNLIKTETLTYSTTYKPTLYDVRVYKVYGDYYPTECYKVTESYTFDETDLVETDSSILNIGDKYYAKDFYQPTSDSEITFDCLTQKHLNGEMIGGKFGVIHSYLGSICKYDNNKFKFLTVTSNEDKTSYTGYVSTYPLYATNTSGNLGLWFLSYSVPIPVKVFKSENGEMWEELKTLSGFTYSTDAFAVTTTALSTVGEDIVYSNYPVYYSFRGDNFETYSSEINISEEDFLNDASLLSLDVDNSFKLYRNADEDFTLDMLPLGANFYFGKYKINDSPRFKIVFRPMDYAENLNNKCGIENYIPNDTVYCESTFFIDYLTFHNQNNYSKTELMYKNAHLPRWLNSDAPEGQWWTAINEYDTPSTEKNMYDSTYIKGSHYDDKAGFLYYFEQEEKNLLRTFEKFENYEELKVQLLSRYDIPSTTTKNTRPKLFEACGSSTVGILRPYYVKEMKYHRNDYIRNYCLEGLNNFACNYSASWFWGREKGTNNGQYYDGTVNGSTAYNANAIRPVVAIDKNTKVKREPDEYGVFSLDLPIKETIDVALEFDIERNLQKEIVKSIDVERIMRFKLFRKLDMLRNTIVDHSRTYQLTREIHNKTFKQFDIERNRVVTKKIYSNVVRDVVGRMTRTHNIYRVILKDYNKPIDILRDVRYSVDIQSHYSIERNVLEDSTIIHNVMRNVAIDLKPEIDILRQVYEAEVFKADVERNVLEVIQKEISVERNIKTIEDIAKNIDIERDIVKLVRTPYEIIRDVRMNYSMYADIVREKVRSNEVIFDIERMVTISSTLEHDIVREVLQDLIIGADIERSIINLFNIIYDIERDIVLDSKYSSDIERIILEDISKEYTLLRLLQGEIIRNYDIDRIVAKSSEQIYSIFRDVLVSTEANYDIERTTLLSLLEELDIERNVLKSIELIVDVERNIVESISKVQDILRNIIVDKEIDADILRDTLSDVLKDIDSTREVLKDYSSNADIERHLLVNICEEYDSIRDILSEMSKTLDIERYVETEAAYVSRENLDYYTRQLKIKIDEYINAKVESLLEEKLKERFK